MYFIGILREQSLILMIGNAEYRPDNQSERVFSQKHCSVPSPALVKYFGGDLKCLCCVGNALKPEQT